MYKLNVFIFFIIVHYCFTRFSSNTSPQVFLNLKIGRIIIISILVFICVYNTFLDLNVNPTTITISTVFDLIQSRNTHFQLIFSFYFRGTLTINAHRTRALINIDPSLNNDSKVSTVTLLKSRLTSIAYNTNFLFFPRSQFWLKIVDPMYSNFSSSEAIRSFLRPRVIVISIPRY